ncbi:MAG: ABC transporter ATP-binding protein [Vicinamibacteraceae bacterium]|nr:ABC transporter ATP-binding protein [Vicinamibacteraceae bacterium]
MSLPSTPAPLIVGERVTRIYRKAEVEVHALRGVDFTIPPASFVSFIGPSGSGKTTLLNLVGALDKPTSGRLEVGGVDIGTLDRRQAAVFRGRHIGFIFQDFNLLPILTVFENVEYPLRLVHPTPAAERRERAMALLDAVGMADQRDKYPDEISGGQKQRVAVARALVTQPKVVLADEPTANLDHETAGLVMKTMWRMTDQFGTTFVFSTHDPKVVREADIIYQLEDGRLVDGPRQGSMPS